MHNKNKNKKDSDNEQGKSYTEESYTDASDFLAPWYASLSKVSKLELVFLLSCLFTNTCALACYIKYDGLMMIKSAIAVITTSGLSLFMSKVVFPKLKKQEFEEFTKKLDKK